jgi:hypothetical protein
LTFKISGKQCEETLVHSRNEQLFAAWAIAGTYIKRQRDAGVRVEVDAYDQPDYCLSIEVDFTGDSVFELYPFRERFEQRCSPEQHLQVTIHRTKSLEDLNWPGRDNFVSAFLNADPDVFFKELDDIAGIPDPQPTFPVRPYELFLDSVTALFHRNLRSADSFSITSGWDFPADEPAEWLERLPGAASRVACVGENPISRAMAADRYWQVVAWNGGRTDERRSPVFFDVEAGKAYTRLGRELIVTDYWQPFIRMQARDTELAAWIQEQLQAHTT